MGRKRTKDTWLPPRVYKGKAAYEFRPITGGAIRLCSLNSSRSRVHKRFAEELEKIECTSGTFKDIALQYQASEKFKLLSPRTQKDYLGYHNKVTKVFGKVHVNNIKPEHIRKYLDNRTAKTQANREKAYLSVVFKWGFERGKVKQNPCDGVANNKEKPRSRYITDKEYLTVYEAASTPVKIAMEISYLCAARIGDVLNMTRNQLKSEGIYIKQSKTGKEQIKRFSSRLEAALKLSKSNIKSIYLVHKEDGDKLTANGFNSAWKRALKKSKLEKAGFTFHDIKAKSISDYEGDKQKFSGHKSAKQVDTYDRKIQVVDSLNVPNISGMKKDK